MHPSIRDWSYASMERLRHLLGMNPTLKVIVPFCRHRIVPRLTAYSVVKIPQMLDRKAEERFHYYQGEELYSVLERIE